MRRAAVASAAAAVSGQFPGVALTLGDSEIVRELFERRQAVMHPQRAEYTTDPPTASGGFRRNSGRLLQSFE